MYIVIPDIHEKVDRLERIMKKYSFIKNKISLGDWYDSWRFASAERIGEVARAHRAFVEDPNNTCIGGNHDWQYAFPRAYGLGCSGFEEWKPEPINKWMKASWNKVVLHKWIETEDKQSWLISHAGFHPSFAHPVFGMTEQHVENITQNALNRLRYEGAITDLFVVGETRGGRADFSGGCTWMDWRDFVPIDGLNQIVGHSYKKQVRTKETETSKNYCIDTGLKDLLILDDDGTVTTEYIYALDSHYRS